MSKLENKITLSGLSSFFIFLFFFSLKTFAGVGGYNFSSTLETFTPLSGQTTTVFNSSEDDFLSNSISIGFDFLYDGVSYSQFKVSSNGFLTFNLNQTSSLPVNSISSNVLIIAPLWDDLRLDATGEIHYQLSGNAPNRVFTIEFINMKWSKYASVPNASFQIKLYESSNIIKFVYGIFNNPNNATASIGISDMLANSTSASLNNYHFMSVSPGFPSTYSRTIENTNVSVLPDFGSGTTYTFIPPSPIATPELTIGVSENYSTLQDAFNFLRDTGISSAITLRILSDYIPESPASGIKIDHIPGASAANKIILKTDPGVSKTISISNATGIDYSIRFRGVRYLTIDGSDGTLIIRNTGTNPSSAIKLMDGVQNCIIRNITLQAEGSTSTSLNGVLFFGSANINNGINITNRENSIINCTITKATQRCANGITFIGGSSSPLNENNRIDSCIINDWGVGTGVAQSGIVLGRGYSNTIISNNEIYMTGAVPSYPTQASFLLGIFANDASTSFSLIGNRIYNLLLNTAVTNATVRGIRIFNNSNSIGSSVVNNMVTLDASSTTRLGTGTMYGISDESSGLTNFYYNSVRIGGNPTTGGGNTAAFDRSSSATNILQNNIFYNARTNSGTATGKHYAIRRTSTTGSFSSNFNDLFVDGNGGIIGLTSSDQLTLTHWIAATSQDSNSLSVNPSFNSSLDLRVQTSSLIESGGTPIIGFDRDKDGELRHSIWPDIGADEFNGLLPGNFSLLSPVNNSTTQPINGSLSWSPSSRVGNYDLYFDTAATPNTLVGSFRTKNSYKYEALQSGQSYYWQVKARNASGESDPLNFPFKFTTGFVPDSPSNIIVTNVTNSSITLNWIDNSSNETGFRVYRSTNSSGPFTQTGTDLPVNSNTFTNINLNPNIRYYYRIVAFNTDGESNFISTDTTTLAATPGSPNLTNVLFTTITITIDTAGNSTSTQFSIYESTTGKFVQSNGTLSSLPEWQTYTSWGRTNGLTVTGLNRSTTYTFSIKARNFNLIETEYSPTSNATTLTPINTFPYSNNFEGATNEFWTTVKFPTTGIPNPANDWERGYSGKLAGPFNGTKAWFTKLTGNYTINHNASLISPEFNFSSFTKAPTISFYHNFKTELYMDAGILEYTTDGGITWLKLGIKNDLNGSNWYNNDSTDIGAPIDKPNWSGTSSGWKNATYKSSIFIGQPVVQFRFRFGSDILTTDEGWAIDNFQIIPPVTKDIQVVSITASQPRMVNYPVAITAKIKNLGTELNPILIPIAYRRTTAPSSFTDPLGVGEIFNPEWQGDSATITFTTQFVPSTTGNHKIYVRSFYTGDEVPTNDSSFTTISVNPQGLFFAEGFENSLFPPTNWSRVDANNDGVSWYRNTSAPYSGLAHASYTFNTTNLNIGADDWLFTSPLNLDASRAYQISFYYRSRLSIYPERLRVTIGTQPNPANQTIQIINLPNITNSTYQQISQAFSIPSTGTYYIGFHCYSNPFMWDLYLDSIRFTLADHTDLAINSLQQVTGLEPPKSFAKNIESIDNSESISKSLTFHLDEVTAELNDKYSSKQEEINTSILALPSANGIPIKIENKNFLNIDRKVIPQSILLKAAIANVGTNDISSYNLNWTVGGAVQPVYIGGYIPRFTGIDTALLNYSPIERGTFFTRAITAHPQDNNRLNDTTTIRTKVYPEVASSLGYDLGNKFPQFRIGYDRQPGRSVTAGVRYTASQDMKIANIDVFYTNKNSSGDTYQSNDSIWIRVWAAGITDSAPGSLLYSKKFAGQNYITSNANGESFTLPLGDDAPAFVYGSDFWVSVTYDSLIRFPQGADIKSTGRSFISANNGLTWNPLFIDIGGTQTECAWWLRCIEVPLGSIQGTKFEDLNGNGVKDTDEPGIANWLIYIDGDISASVLTDSNGNYSFTNLEGGTYLISEEHQQDWVQTLPAGTSSYTINLYTGGSISHIDFGNFRLGSISGMKFNDLNGDGIKDDEETGIENWKILLFNTNILVDSTLTDEYGNYYFSNLGPGLYTITEEYRNGWLQTLPHSQSDYSIYLTSGANIFGKDFGNFQTSAISGIKFHDLNANGIRDNDDLGLQNWQIKLFLNEVDIDSTLTDSLGAYSFYNLGEGNYTITEIQQEGWLQSYPDSSGVHTVTLGLGSTFVNVNFGNYKTGSITGVVFNDRNGNGLKDSIEQVLEGWTVIINGEISDTTHTNAAGEYLFDNLIPGTYTINILIESGWGQSYPQTQYEIILSSGFAVSDKNFGVFRFARVSGLKFKDLNGNGFKETEEPGIQNWMIRIHGPVTDSIFTDENGYFVFNNLTPGLYNVSEILKTGWMQTFPNPSFNHSIVINGGDSITNINFGNFKFGSISGLKFNDFNANGIKDSSDYGLSNWRIRLIKDGNQIDSTLTDGTGNYIFTGLGVGSYSVTEAAQVGWIQSFPLSPDTHFVSITSGSEILNRNFGNYQLSSISGNIFNDRNGNGVKELNETGLSGWKIILLNNSIQIDSAISDINGNYTFLNIVPRLYTIKKVDQSGWIQTLPASGDSHTLTVTGSSNLTGINFGLFQSGLISGIKFHDVNGDGLFNANETGLNNWLIRLSRGGTIVDSIFTEPNGEYQFSGLIAGTYVVSEVLQNGWGQSYPSSNGNYTIVITSGTISLNNNFGNYQFSTISGNKFQDINGDGIKNQDESGLVSWQINLFQSGKIIDSIITDINGNYTFNNIKPGMYTVTEVIKSGWLQTYPDSPGNYTITLTSGSNITEKDFGNFKLGTISGLKFEDKNGNGIRDLEEPGLSNWQIILLQNEVIKDSIRTDFNGNFKFLNLKAGNYTITETNQPGWIQSTPPNPGNYNVDIISGSSIEEKVFGNYRYGSIRGIIYNDTNGNGIKDGSEPGIENSLIRLLKNDVIIDSIFSDLNGNYIFNDLEPHLYSITQILPLGWVQTEPISQIGFNIFVNSGENVLNKNFGNFKLGKISGFKFNDLNGDGIYYQTDPPISGSLIQLYKDQNIIDSTLTDFAGKYEFHSLISGNYIIKEILPEGWRQTFPINPEFYTINIKSGDEITDLNFGNFKFGIVRGKTFHDLNGNKIKEIEEPGLPDWLIRISQNGINIDSVNTDIEGQFSFQALTAGTYQISQSIKDNWYQSIPEESGTYTVIITSGSEIPDNNFGNFMLASLNGMKFNDLNSNGVKDEGEPGLLGWQIRAVGPSELSTNTEDNGQYSIKDLLPGRYILSEVQKSGWTQTLPVLPETYTIDLVSGQHITNRDFGNFRSGTIRGTVFLDVNGNGSKDISEPTLPGRKILLYKNSLLVDSISTDSFGFYQFGNLTAGNYTIYQVITDNWIQSFPTAPGFHSVVITSGLVVTDKDFGNYQFSSINGSKFNDLNGNGIKDENDQGLPNWKIFISGETLDSISTDDQGNYTFSNLKPGNYILYENNLNNWINTLPVDESYSIILTSGNQLTEIDFGNFRTGTISGMKFNDLNGNGIKDGGETGLLNWRIRLHKDGIQIDSTLTDASGNYSFINLTAGTYTVSAQLQSGWIQTTSPTSYNINVTSGTNSENNNFGNFRTGSISGIKFNDLNGNGINDGGETGLLNWRIRLYKDGIQTDSTLTDASGNFSFINLTAGTYTVSEQLQPGWIQTTSPTSYNINVTSGTNSENNNFGNFRTGSVGGMKFNDLNGNGTKDGGETGLTSWRIRLHKDGYQVDSTLTDASGNYSFINLTAGIYTVSEQLQPGWIQTTLPASYTINVTSGINSENNNFGNFRTGSVGGMKFNDLNGNGTKDGGETGLTSWRIRLHKDGYQVDSTLTDASGNYSFTNLTAGTYTVSEQLQPGWIQTTSPTSYTINVSSGANSENNNFGNFRIGSISGIKFNDLNGNGTKDGGETGLTSWRIRLHKDGYQVDSTLTDASGNYSFINLTAGIYTVSEQLQPGWIQTTLPASYTINVTSGINSENNNFGNFRTGSVGGMKFNDLNGNGTKDGGETGLTSWRIRLHKDGIQTDSTLTDASGNYSFINLTAGTYTVSEQLQPGWIQTTSPTSYTINVSSGTNSENNNFGNFRTGSISGIKFNDLNGNGIKDGGETGLLNWRIRLHKDGYQADSILTDVSGNYSFTNLTAGTYTVSEQLQTGWIQTTSPTSYTINVLSGTNSENNNFGNFRTGSVNGMKFNDLNGNGTKDGGETGLLNWRIRLHKDGNQVDSTLTDASGNYSFTNLTAGAYSVSEQAQTGWYQSSPSSSGIHIVQIFSGTNLINHNFGNYRRGNISGVKFNDLNGNGIKDVDDPIISNWKIYISGPINDSTVTDLTGYYQFSELNPGTYIIKEESQNGWIQTFPYSQAPHMVVLSSGSNVENKNFGNFQTTGISGIKFNDLNANGVRDIDEPGLSNWQIRLLKDDIIIDSAITDSGGGYRFTNLTAGTYVINEINQNNWIQSYPPSPGNHTVIIISGNTIVNKDFGNYQYGNISGKIFNDLNGNGIPDQNDLNIAGWKIRLSGLKIDSTFSDEIGNYSFNNLIPGNYSVTIEPQNGWLQTVPSSPTYYDVVIYSGNLIINQDFGLFNLSSISGMKFDDLNGNGIKDGGETGLLNWRIRLHKDGIQTDSTLTDASGNYSFINLTAGTYTVSEQLQPGWIQTTSPKSYNINITSGTNSENNNFGNFRTGSISGIKFNDLNGNGIKDGGKTGLLNWRIRLHNDGIQTDSTLTDASGNYSFINLTAGTYTVREQLQPGWIQTTSPSAYTINVSSGTNSENNNFGNFRTGTISGMKFNDLNGNGIKDGGETGLLNWRIRLHKDGIQTDSTLTDASGNYFFTNLTAGTYTVSEQLQSGWIQTTSPTSYDINVSSSTNSENNNFGNFRTGSVSGIKFNDLNGNGIKDGNETGLLNWRIRLHKDGIQTDSTLTDASGNYSFINLTAGTYTVSEQLQPGWIQTTSPTSYTINVLSGTNSENNNFGNFRTGSIGGMKFNDLNGNGIKDGGETGLLNWRIRLHKDGIQTDSTLTDASGNYFFTNLTAGTYTVNEQLQPGWIQTTLPASYTINVTSGTNSENNNFGNFRTGTISGMKFNDLNGNGIKDGGETGLLNWRIRLHKDGFQADSTLTDASGNYLFINLTAGTYTVSEQLQPGWIQTTSPTSYTINVTSGTNSENNNFGNFRTGTISGMKFNDLNGNGIKDGGETGLLNWRIRLHKDGIQTDSTFTDASGNYLFTNLTAGTYTVSEQLQPGWIQTTSPTSYNINITSGINSENNNFGNFRTGSINGIKFNDLNGNGIKDVNEPGLLGWRIRLSKSGIQVDSILTDENGNYSFSNLTVGTYTVSEAQSSGWLQTLPVSQGTYSVTINSGTIVNNRNFGNFQLGGINGIKFNDLNGNGIKDNGEPPLPDWKINLNGPINTFTLTNEFGEYSFTNLLPGIYTISEELKNEWVQSFPSPQGIYTIPITSGTNETNKDFGNYKYSSISGILFNDINGNGVKDIDDLGLSGWRVYLHKNNVLTDSAMTSGTGNYLFNNLQPGSYTISAVTKSGWTQTLPDSHGTHTVNLISGSNENNKYFGFFKFSNISGITFHDLNGNGIKDIGEPILSNWKIRLKKNEVLIDSMFTDINGNYLFNNLLGGIYNVSEVLQPNWKQTLPSSPEGYNVVITSGISVTSKSFGNFELGKISGIKFNDLNGNGLKDGNEPVLGNWRIRLSLDGTQIDSILTDENGQYFFSNLSTGNYIISEQLQPGWIQTTFPLTHQINISSGTNSTNNNFGNFNRGSISGLIFDDFNGNGTKDDIEPGIKNWRAMLYSSGIPVDSILTDSSGYYHFSNLNAGNYTINQQIQQGWILTTIPSSFSVNITSGTISTNNNFGNFKTGIIGGKIYNDINGNGAWDIDESGLSNLKVKLYKNEIQVDSTLSDIGGNYTFTGLTTGEYIINLDLQIGWIQTSSPSVYSINISSGTVLLNNAFGIFQTGIISGIKFNDLNGNGTKDTDEPGIIGWKIKLTQNGLQIDSTFTDNNGTYSFAGLKSGNYIVNEEYQTGWIQTTFPSSFDINITSGINSINNNFGNYKLGLISGTKFNDLNGNGIKDDGEPGLTGWKIKLNKGALQIDSTTTIENGHYSFIGLSAGTYSVSEENQTGWILTSSPQTHTINISSGLNSTNNNFGNYLLGIISGITFNDINGNGIKDEGEPELDNWKIRLSRNEMQVDSILTDQNGNYTFTNLIVGNYTVSTQNKSGWIQTTSPPEYNIVVSSGTFSGNNDFGNFQTGTLSGMKFNDLNANRIKDDGEPGIPGWTIRLFKDELQIDSLLTDSSGVYIFNNLTFGQYTISEESRTGWHQTYPFPHGIHTASIFSGSIHFNLDFGNTDFKIMTYTYYPKWNLISIPLVVSDFRKNVIFPTSSTYAFRFENKYIISDTLSNRFGYWLGFNSPALVEMFGIERNIDTTHVFKGWNMIGTLSTDIEINNIVTVPPNIITSNIFGYNNAYFFTDTLKSFRGYWIKTNSNGIIILDVNNVTENSNLIKLKSEKTFDDLNEIIFTNKFGISQSLYIGTGDTSNSQLFELPPQPPEGGFDVRFTSDKMAEIHNNVYDVLEYEIIINSEDYPISIKYSPSNNNYEYYLSYDEENSSKFFNLRIIDSLVIYNKEIKSIKLYVKSYIRIPDKFSLEQNYPNPFNPSTEIKFALLSGCNVNLSIYNILGQEVCRLINQDMNVGFYSIKWKPESHIASGVYFYKIETKDINSIKIFTAIKKMLYLK